MPISTIDNTGLTSPLPAANLGTPSAINLSNATALPSVALPTGCVLQVVYGYTGTQVTTSSTTPVDIGLSATITPKFATSKILIMLSVNGVFVNAVASGFANFLLARNGSSLGSFGYIVGYTDATINRAGACSFQSIDAPATTSATTYKVQTWALNGATINVQRDSQAISSIVLMEIAG